MASAGFLIYSGVIPLIKIFISMFAGYYFARKDLFPQVATRGASQIAINLAFPPLIFSSIVPAFTKENVSAIGPTFLIALIYGILGLLFGLVIREVCYVPRNFWQGIIVACCLGNWGNLPAAVIIPVTQQPPFNPPKDTNLGISFIGIFVVVYNVFFWICGLARSLAWDMPQASRKGRKPKGEYRSPLQPPDISVPQEKADGTPETNAPSNIEEGKKLTSLQVTASSQTERGSTVLPVHAYSPSTTESPPNPRFKLFIQTLSFIFAPINLVIGGSLCIALVQPLKALFVDVSAEGGPSWKGPDGKPPLAFLIDTAAFLGDITIPLSLVLLGASFARMKIPRPISRLPVAAILSVCVAKLVLLPIIGILIVQAMVRGGLIPPQNRVQIFAAMYLSGTPTSITQLVVSALYSPDGELDTFSVRIYSFRRQRAHLSALD
ncbi:hypothetical protein BDM02DRAFT_3186745 [Thelephora ganbajun]|uniref:Uncharacterized protein n=1 Tax=Thelephora ganbajun TaxID=370292 RepID=A0ACB6ZGD9_THEGA|nr:hypothetical protein BDM02DRAFT_3186745 [Thelephora ganbajun]